MKPLLAIVLSTIITLTLFPAFSSASTSTDQRLLAKLVQAEAGGESYRGKVAVAQVVLNRVKHKSFPSSVKGVIYQRGQFSPVIDGSINKKPLTRSALDAVKQAYRAGGNKNGSIYFYNPRIAKSSWLRSRTVTKRIGNHVFLK